PDHLDWHGSMDAYRDAKARIYAGVTGASVFNAADQWAAAAAADAAPQPAAAAPGGQPDSLAAADILAGTFQAPAFDLDSRPDSSLGVTGAAGPKLVGFTLAPPAAGQLGLADGWVVDRAFGPGPGQQLVELATLGHLAGPDGQLAPHTQANILAAAALARAYGVEARGIGQGLGQFRTGAHRLELVHQAGGVRFINDSKATNAHAAAAALSAFPPGKVVWIAGGLAKGARFEDLIKARGDRLKAAVLIGLDNSELTEALDRHAPSVPVWRIEPGGDVMGRAVARAAALASASDVVLLAPASASMDQFSSYAERGQQFAAAAKEIGG
ncbi:MAG: hypothetical protein LBH68_07465, partial [Bifidobacteriaceae bacterium]|nr:hypothetical protein [Bifidobacteriaceae bacterium]